ncbi:hypothetical protein SKAU_G00080330 [Synaphobranchus kaupii]|uniref:PH domain-containing protein n=1 Tax=Synaphobranchus kaupii TaxID=118154 RepID=A0A9Q1FVI8_SYNKA|nr:hypothetical protein SKAU_G00080330 [Synaphobranchus kaupii]
MDVQSLGWLSSLKEAFNRRPWPKHAFLTFKWNHMLLRVLPSVYRKQPEAIHLHIGELTAMMSQLEQPEQQHLLRLLQMVAKQHPLALSSLAPSLVGYLNDPVLNDAVLTVLVDVSLASPASLSSFLPTLRSVGQQCPALLGHVAKIHGAVGLTNEEQAHSSLVYLVSLLASMEHSLHHTLLLEIRGLTDHYPSILGGCGKDIYRMSNSFTAIARLLGRRLEADLAAASRVEDEEAEQCPQSCDLQSSVSNGDEKLQVKIQAFEEKMGEDGEVERESESGSPGPQRRHSLGQAAREERREMRFNRSKSLAVHAVRSRSINSENSQEGEGAELSPEAYPPEGSPGPESGRVAEGADAPPEESPAPPPPDAPRAPCADGRGQTDVDDPRERDKLWVHLKDNEEKIKAFCADIIKRIPVPEQCVVEDSSRDCVAKLSFSCPMKGHYCLYGKSSFTLSSRQPHLWLHIMLLSQQSKASEPLSSEDKAVQFLRVLWEKAQLKGLHTFETVMTQSTFPHKKDLDSLQRHLEEVRFFDLFGYSEEQGSWLCFMCNNPEKATVVNQEGQPLIEGKLKEKQVRWKFIKRWKTRYFTLAGNQLLFRKGKSKDELEDSPIELSKVQSVKVVAKKRRDRSLPRAFEIFTDSKTYVLKAQDEKHAEEWLQYINVAMAQAKERESLEATTYL